MLERSDHPSEPITDYAPPTQRLQSENTRKTRVVQDVLFGPLATLARRAGRDPLRADLHGPAAACVIPEPGSAQLAALLERPVRTRAARRRG